MGVEFNIFLQICTFPVDLVPSTMRGKPHDNVLVLLMVMLLLRPNAMKFIDLANTSREFQFVCYNVFHGRLSFLLIDLSVVCVVNFNVTDKDI